MDKASRTLAQLQSRVAEALRNEEDFVFNLCNDLGQVFEMVKDATWFHNVIAEHLVTTYPKTWGHLAREDRNYMYIDRRYYGSGYFTKHG
jgi:hypothetical protein